MAPAAMVVPWQFWLALNSTVDGAPPNMLIGPNGSELVLVTTAATVELVVPTGTAPKSMLVGVTVIGLTPVPLSVTENASPSAWLAVWLIVKLDVSLKEPGPLGEKL